MCIYLTISLCFQRYLQSKSVELPNPMHLRQCTTRSGAVPADAHISKNDKNPANTVNAKLLANPSLYAQENDKLTQKTRDDHRKSKITVAVV